MPKNDGFFKMRTCDDLLFGRNESQRHVWRPVGGRGWTSFTSDIVVISNLGGTAVGDGGASPKEYEFGFF